MAEGGMYDQIGGRFHRYSVDKQWFVPHFEKMLYDQAQLIDSYLDAYQVTGDKHYSLTAREIFGYMLRDMRDDGGGIYSAEDADSENPYAPAHLSEGAFYLWEKQDIVNRLGTEQADIFNFRFGVKDTGNVKQDPLKEFTDRNILYKANTFKQTAAFFKKNTQQIEKSLATSKKNLFKARELRRRPHLDDKVITAWNGMMTGALARGSRILQDPQLLEAAIHTATFLRKHLYNSSDHTLHRRYREQQAGLPGQLSDYTFLVDGLLELYQASHDPKWLSWSVNLTSTQLRLFWNEPGGFFFDSVADPSVKIRMRSRYDGAEPTGNSVAAHNLLRLGQLQHNIHWQKIAHRLMESFSTVINRYPPALPLMLTAWQQSKTKPTQVVIAGERDGKDTQALLAIVNRSFDPDRLVFLVDGGVNQEYLTQKLPFLKNMVPINGLATAYVCTDFTCKLPVTDPVDLQKQLEEE